LQDIVKEIAMPLVKSSSSEAVGKNYKKERESGKSKKQSLAIALATERKYAKGNRKAKLEDAYAKYIESKA
jgi:hypothetical protein